MTASTQFTDSGGIRWTVYESPANHIVFDDRLIDEAPAHLTFEATVRGRTYMRRLRAFPATWRDLSSATLEDLLRHADRVGAGRAYGESDAMRRSIDQLTT